MKIEINTKSCVPLFAAFFVLPMLFALNSFTDTSKYRIKQITNLITEHTSEYFYNPSGQIIQVKNSKGNNINYQYIGNKIIKTAALSSGTSSDTFFLNGAGFIDEAHQQSPAGSYLYRYKFTNDGFNKEIKSYYNKENIESVFNQAVVNGNITLNSSVLSTSDGKKFNEAYFYYYPNTKNTIGNENMGMAFMGKSSANLLAKVIGIIDKDTTISFCKYRFDDKGRVTIRTSYYQSGKLIDSTGYSYY